MPGSGAEASAGAERPVSDGGLTAKDVLGPAAEQVTSFLISLLNGDSDTAAKIAAAQTTV
jgi:hypothetical protein